MARLKDFTLKATPVGADEIFLASTADGGAERRASLTSALTGQTLTNCTLANPTLTTPDLGVATSTTINGVSIVTAAGAIFQMAPAKTLAISNTMELAGTDGATYTFPTSTATLARTSGANTFSGTQTFATVVLTGNATTAGTLIQTSASSAAFASGLNGNTNPVFRLVNNIASQATGISITGRAAAAGADITVLSSGTNEDLRLNAKGSGTISLNPTGTGNIVLGTAATGVSLSVTGAVTAFNATAVPAGGTTGSGFLFSSTANLGVFFGSGVPTLSAAQGSLYVRTDGSSSSTRIYVNSTGSTTWVAVTTAS